MDPKKKKSRRNFMKGSAAVAGLAVGGAVAPAGALLAADDGTPEKSVAELVAYGERSKFVTSVRIPVAERPSPDAFGLLFHVLSPLQDQVGSITPSSLHFIGTHRGAKVPDIDPRTYRLLIEGMVDRPLEFTLDDLMRFPSVSRPHFVECAGNRANARDKTVQETHGLTSCALWTGVPLSLLLKECGVQNGASWMVSEGDEEVHGAESVRLAKAMDDVLVCYGQNGELLRPQNGFPVRLIVPGFEGIYNTKWLRKIKVVDRFYMTYNDYGHIQQDPKVVELSYEWGPKSVITFPSGGQKLSSHGTYQMRGLAWSGGGAVRKVEISTDDGQTWKDAEITGPVHRMAHTSFGMTWKWEGQECVLKSRCTDEVGQVQPTREDLAKYLGHPADYFKTRGVQGLDNTIMPWRIANDGTVHNGLA
jgi:sulfane dehydrogenase subunit SoxC